MELRPLGKSGIEVSVFALGCWPFIGGAYWGAQDDRDSIATVHAALDAGINFFDTAEGYADGYSERVLGQALQGRRDQAIIATKVMPGNLCRADVFAACEGSLRNLQVDYIDLYQIHWPNHAIPLAETVEALEELRGQGKIRAWGVSNFAVQDLSEVLALGPCVTNQLPYSLLWRVIERAVQPLCVAHDIGILCYSPLAQGLLTGRYARVEDVPAGLMATRWYDAARTQADHGEGGCEAAVFAALAGVRRVAEGLGRPLAEVALAWGRQQAGVTSLLVGARRPQELAWNLPALTLTLPADALAELDRVTQPVKDALGDNPDMWEVPSRMR